MKYSEIRMLEESSEYIKDIIIGNVIQDLLVCWDEEYLYPEDEMQINNVWEQICFCIQEPPHPIWEMHDILLTENIKQELKELPAAVKAALVYTTPNDGRKVDLALEIKRQIFGIAHIYSSDLIKAEKKRRNRKDKKK